MKRIAVILSIFYGAFSASGQMTLNDCLIYAREHAHSNVISRLETEVSKADQGMAMAGLMPSVALSTSGNLSFGRNIDPETNTYDNKQTLSTGFGLTMQLPLFDGLVSINTLKAAKVARLRSVKAAKVEEDRVSLNVVRSFFNVSYYKALVEQMESQVKRDSTNLAACERQEELGVKSGADVAELQAIVASDRYELVNQQNLLAKAYLQLRSDMGMELTDEPLSLIEDESLVVPVQTKPAISNPKVEEARLALKESQIYLRAAKGRYSPQLHFSGGISTSYYKMMGSQGYSAPSFHRQFRDNLGEYIGLSLSIPLFDGLSTFNRVRKAKVEVAESQTRLDQAIYELEKETTEARLDLKGASEELNSARLRMNAEQIAYDATSRKFELGTASAIDLYTAGAKLATARANLEGTRIRQIVASITLSYYLGEELIKDE